MAVAEQAFEATVTSTVDRTAFSRGEAAVMCRNYREKMQLAGGMVWVGRNIKILSSYGGCAIALGLLFVYGSEAGTILPPATSAMISVGAGWILENGGRGLYFRSAKNFRRSERELKSMTLERDSQTAWL